jgi:hypothetical protein
LKKKKFHHAIIISAIVRLPAIEVVPSYKENKHLYKRKDTLSNMAAGVGYFTCNMLTKSVLFFVFSVGSKI